MFPLLLLFLYFAKIDSKLYLEVPGPVLDSSSLLAPAALNLEVPLELLEYLLLVSVLLLLLLLLLPYLEYLELLLSLLLSLFRLEYLLMGASELSLQLLPYLLVPELELLLVSLLLSLLKVSLQLDLTEEPFSNLDVPLELLSYLLLELPFSYLLELLALSNLLEAPLSYLVVDDPFSYLLELVVLAPALSPYLLASNLDSRSEPPTPVDPPTPSELAVLTGRLLYLGSEELESLLARLVLQLGVLPPVPAAAAAELLEAAEELE